MKSKPPLSTPPIAAAPPKSIVDIRKWLCFNLVACDIDVLWCFMGLICKKQDIVLDTELPIFSIA